MIFSHRFSLKIFCTAFCLFLSGEIYCQDTADAKFIIAKFSPLTLLESDAGFQLGVENKLSRHVALQNEFAYLFLRYDFYDRIENLNLYNEDEIFEKKKYRGFAYKAELRVYPFTQVSMHGFYVTPQFIFKWITWLEMHGVGTTTIERPNNKTLYQGNFKIGYQHIFGRGFSIDFYSGAGLKYRITNEIKLQNSSTRNMIVTTVTSTEQKKVLPSFLAGLRLGWAF